MRSSLPLRSPPPSLSLPAGSQQKQPRVAPSAGLVRSCPCAYLPPFAPPRYFFLAPQPITGGRTKPRSCSSAHLFLHFLSHVDELSPLGLERSSAATSSAATLPFYATFLLFESRSQVRASGLLIRGKALCAVLGDYREGRGEGRGLFQELPY